MPSKTIYLALCILGAALPIYQFALWLHANGLAPGLALAEILSSHLSLFAWLDVIISAVALVVFIAKDSSRTGVLKPWLLVLATLSVGVSLGLPLYLYLREVSRERDGVA